MSKVTFTITHSHRTRSYACYVVQRQEGNKTRIYVAYTYACSSLVSLFINQAQRPGAGEPPLVQGKLRKVRAPNVEQAVRSHVRLEARRYEIGTPGDRLRPMDASQARAHLGCMRYTAICLPLVIFGVYRERPAGAYAGIEVRRVEDDHKHY